MGSPENIKALKDSENPYDLNLLENAELQDLLDEKASKVVVDVKANFYAQVVIKHLIKIDLPEQVIENVLPFFFVDQTTTAR